MSTRSSLAPSSAPSAIRYAAAGTLLAAAIQILVGALLWTHRSEFALAQARLHPAMAAAAAADRADGIVYGALAVHLVLFVAYLVLARGVLLGRRSARMRLSTLLVIAIVAGTVAATSIATDVPGIRAGMIIVQAISTTLRLGVLLLLWIPQDTHEHFAHPRVSITAA